MPITPRLIVVGLVEHGRRGAEPTYVVTKRRHNQHLPGAWELPGGKVEPGEAPAEALQRELREELGVEVTQPTPLTFSYHHYADRTLLLLFFRARTLPTSPAPAALEADAIALLTRSELIDLPMPPANAPLKAAMLLISQD